MAAFSTVTVKPVFALPPLSAGGDQLTVAEASPAVAVPMIGALGTVSTAVGVTLLENAEAAPVPTPLIALTLNLTAVPFTRPVKTRLVAPAPGAD